VRREVVKFRGRVFKVGDEVDTDVIIPARYLNTTDPKVLASHCLEGIDPDFPKKVTPGDMLFGGRNFGCGSSREHAPLAIKSLGISCVVAKSFARIFYRNAFNVGLPAVECEEAVEESETGDHVEVDLESGELKNLSRGKVYRFKPLPPFMIELIREGGLVNYISKRLRGEEVL
jgi:3-isopropylmalate/(R)-2-methylmalate dehydratase small subunit